MSINHNVTETDSRTRLYNISDVPNDYCSPEINILLKFLCCRCSRMRPARGLARPKPVPNRKTLGARPAREPVSPSAVGAAVVSARLPARMRIFIELYCAAACVWPCMRETISFNRILVLAERECGWKMCMLVCGPMLIVVWR